MKRRVIFVDPDHWTQSKANTMSTQRPLCTVCHQRPRQPGTARCPDCGPGRITRPQGNEHTNTNTVAPDPLRAAFDNYRPAPADIVPTIKSDRIDDLVALAGHTVPVTYIETDEQGEPIGVTTENQTILAPYTQGRDSGPT